MNTCQSCQFLELLEPRPLISRWIYGLFRANSGQISAQMLAHYFVAAAHRRLTYSTGTQCPNPSGNTGTPGCVTVSGLEHRIRSTSSKRDSRNSSPAVTPASTTCRAIARPVGESELSSAIVVRGCFMPSTNARTGPT